jgi:signal transduction histidine kinase
MKVAGIPFPLAPQFTKAPFVLFNNFSKIDVDSISSLAAQLSSMPVSFVSLIDNDYNWFKSNTGISFIEKTSDLHSYWQNRTEAHLIQVIEDLQLNTPQFNNILHEFGKGFQFYAGIPLINNDGVLLGALNVLDDKPNKLNITLSSSLYNLAKQLVTQIELVYKLEELEYAAEELKKKNSEISRYAYLISHDLRSPLQSMSSLSKIIKEESIGKLSDKANVAISMLQNRAVHSHELVEGILKHAIAGVKAYNAELIHVEKFIQDLIIFCNPPSDFEIVTEVSIPEIYTDPIILHQIINNLLCNAFKYNDKPLGRIKIIVKGDDEQLTFEVIDNGPGIPMEFHERIFEMFQTLSQTDRFGNKGTGIGLNTVKNLVASLGGQISIKSKVGEGSSFKITLKNYTSDLIEENLTL